MNEITIMENPRFGKVRKVMVNGEWYYVALDIAKALGYAKERNAIAAHCRCALKRGVPHPQNPNKEIEMTIIPKGDVLRLISESHLPAAEEFNHWLFDDVAVSVVDTGMYLTPERTQQLFADPASIIATGWFYVRVTPHPNSPNNVLRRTTMVTPKGQIYFLKHFCGKNYRLNKGEDLIHTTIEENLLPFEEDLSCNDEDLF